MEPRIEDLREAIRELCDKYRVKRLEIFGSAAREDFDPERSDLDFLVEFLPIEPGKRADAYFGLLEDLKALLGRDVDLVMPSAIRNPYFLESINRNRTTLYAA